MTKLIINDLNKSQYNNGTYPEVTSIILQTENFNPDILKNFPNLNYIESCNNKISDPSKLQYCTLLTTLGLGHNQISDLSLLQYCPALTLLWCSHNNISDLTPIQHCKSLTEFTCWNNQISDLTPIQHCKSLTKLYCHSNKISDISPLQYCTSLTRLECMNNQISDLNSLRYCKTLNILVLNKNLISDLTPIQYCARLTGLSFCDNQISDISPLQHCTSLTSLYCFNNAIIDLSPLQYCTLLTQLGISDNQISDISPLRYCTSLNILYCNNNQISDISPLRYCTLLTELFCNNNQISDISPLEHCTLLSRFNCCNNQITNLDPLIYLREIYSVRYENNPLNPFSIQVVRLLERLEGVHYDSDDETTIYSDTQNVHNIQVQRSIMDSIRNLMKDNTDLNLDIDSILTSELKASTKSRLLEYFEDAEPHIILLITYKELFTYVWNRIINNPNKLELLKILDDNIQDSECKCFTGRFNRTLSTLVGFYDDIQINISDNSRISAIILNIKNTIIPYDSNKHRELAQTALSEAGYDSEIVNLWIEAIE